MGKARGTDLRVSFKNTYNTAKAVRNMTLNEGKAYLNACLERQRCIPMRKFCGSQGRHAQVNKAPNGRRRTYRAHGRITPFMSHPCHVEMWAAIKDQGVAKAKPSTAGLSLVKQARSRAQGRLREGESK